MEIEVTNDNFKQEVVKSQLPVVVDFWAPWCGPCKVIAPYLEELAKEFGGKLKVCKLNVDKAPEIATKYMVMSIPTVMLFKQGQALEKKVGLLSKENLREFIKGVLK